MLKKLLTAGVFMGRLSSILLCIGLMASCATVTPEVPPAEGAIDSVDSFGGWADKQASTITTVNRNADGSAHATSISATVLTDITRNWTPDSLIGYNLQPNVATNMFFEISDNDATTITVVATDRAGGPDLTDYNSGTDEYRVLNDWGQPVLIDNRYWFIDPQDNTWLGQGMNNFWDGTGNNGQGVDQHGNSLRTVLATKYGDSDTREKGRIPTLKEFHFNALGEYANPNLYPGADGDVTSEYYMPYIELVRPSVYWRPDHSWTYANDVEIQPGSVFHDVFDPDWETAVFGSMDDGAFDDMGATQQSYNITPYDTGWLNCAASPYCQGVKIEDEPSEEMLYKNTSGVLTWVKDDSGGRCSANFIHMGFMPFVSHLHNGTEISQTKAFYTNMLRAKYTDGDESTFITNISFDGSDESTTYDAWSGVPGYVSSAKDTAALVNLNTAWATSYASWEEVYKNDNSDPADSKTGSSNITFSDSNPDTIIISGDTWDFSPEPYFIKISGTAHNDGIYEIANYSSSSITVLASESLTAEANTSATLSTIGQIYGKVANDQNGSYLTDLTPNGHNSAPRSSTPPQILADLNTMSEYYWRRWSSAFNDWRDDRLKGKKILTAMHQDFDKAETEKIARWYGFMSDDFSTHYMDIIAAYGDMPEIALLSGETDMPIWTNTYWHLAAIDTSKGATGTVDAILYTSIITGVTDASGNTGKDVIDTDTSDTVVTDRPTQYSTTSLEIADNACSNDFCATVFCNTDTSQCSDVEFYGNREGGVSTGADLPQTHIVLVDEGVTGNSIHYELRSYNKLYDADGKFVSPWEHEYDYRKLWYVSGQEKSITAYNFANGTDPNAMTCRIGLIPDGTTDTITLTNYCTGGNYTCSNTRGRNCYGFRCINLNHWLPEGTQYVIGTDIEYGGCPSERYVNLTQEQRGQDFYDTSLEKFNYLNSDGDYYYIRQDWWSWWDYGQGYTENVNFGWCSGTDNCYDGDEATQLGADNTPDTWDDEEEDYGDFITTAKSFTQNLYQLLTEEEVPSSFNSSLFGRILLKGSTTLK